MTMPQKENPGKGQTQRDAANRGQDEVLHEIQMPDGSDVRQVTQREWRETYRDLGYVREPGVFEDDEATPEEQPGEDA
jgi:hypothetical protein